MLLTLGKKVFSLELYHFMIYIFIEAKRFIPKSIKLNFKENLNLSLCKKIVLNRFGLFHFEFFATFWISLAWCLKEEIIGRWLPYEILSNDFWIERPKRIYLSGHEKIQMGCFFENFVIFCLEPGMAWKNVHCANLKLVWHDNPGLKEFA